MDEIAKYRKKKPQNSKSSRRSDHKHVYEKCIQIGYNRFRPELISYIRWSMHCSVCGREDYVGSVYWEDDEVFIKPEYRGRHLWSAPDMYRPVEEILSEFPDVPVYETDINNDFKVVRIR